MKKLKMQKRVTKMEDGRYLIYYSFTSQSDETKDKKQMEKKTNV